MEVTDDMEDVPKISAHTKLDSRDEQNYLEYSCESVANYLLQKAKDDEKTSGLTSMHLNKLVYIMFGWVAALHRKYLFKETIEAWRYGPVIPNLYHTLKHNGNRFITEPLMGTDFDENGSIQTNIKPKLISKDDHPKVYDTLEQTWKNYKNYSAVNLMNITHAKGSPWSYYYREEISNIEIEKDFIRFYYAYLNEKKHKENALSDKEQVPV